MTAKQGVIGRRYVIVDGKKYELIKDNIYDHDCRTCDFYPGVTEPCYIPMYTEEGCEDEGYTFKRMEEE